jgi:cobyrinic acid a,c-diamide synthase
VWAQSAILEWVTNQLNQLTGVQAHRKIAEAKYLLQEKHMELRRSVPKAHLKIGTARHRCLWQVYEETYNELDRLAYSLTPTQPYQEEPKPQLRKVPPPPPIVYAGTILGEVE